MALGASYNAFDNPYASTDQNGNVSASWTPWKVNTTKGRYPGFDVSKIGIGGLAPALFSQIGFANQMEPIRESMIQNFINQNNPQNQNYLIDASRRNAFSQAQDSQAQMGASGFYGGGYTDPSTAINAANEAGQNTFTQVHSGDYQNQLYSNVLGAVNQGQNLSLLSPMEGLTAMNVGTPRSAPGGLAAVGQMLGQGIGMLTGGASPVAAASNVFGGATASGTGSGALSGTDWNGTGSSIANSFGWLH